MRIGAGGRSALILAVGFFVCCAGPSDAAYAATDTAFVRGSLAQARGILMAAPGNPVGTRTSAGNLVVAADQLNEVDRALHEDTPPAPAATRPANHESARRVAVVMAGGDHSVWRETSPMGKIFVAFGALLTLASAARMFMA